MQAIETRRLSGRAQTRHRIVGALARARHRRQQRRSDHRAPRDARRLQSPRLLRAGIRQQTGARHSRLCCRRPDDLRDLPRRPNTGSPTRRAAAKPRTARSRPNWTICASGRRRRSAAACWRLTCSKTPKAVCWSTRSTTRWNSATAARRPASILPPKSSATPCRRRDVRGASMTSVQRRDRRRQRLHRRRTAAPAAFPPQVEVTQITSRENAGHYVHTVHPNLRGASQLAVHPPGRACSLRRAVSGAAARHDRPAVSSSTPRSPPP